MEEIDFIKSMWRSGHFWNPAYPATLNVKESDLPKLRLTDKVVQFAVASFQMGDSNMHTFASLHHKRAPMFDGDVGPATMDLIAMPRCPMPDFAPPPGATFDYGDESLNRCVESMQRRADKATGSGSWPHGCHGKPDVHEVKISYDLRNLTAKHKEWWPEITRLSHAAVADIGILLTEVPVGEKANITVYGRVLSGSVIGMAEFNSGQCGDTVFCQLNPNFAPSLASVLKLLLHENGHNWNLEHKAGNIMNPSITPDSVPNYWIKREGGQATYTDNSYPTLRRFFGGEPTTPPEPPIGVPSDPYMIALAGDLPAGVCTIKSGDKVINAAVSSPRLAGTYLMTKQDPLPPK